MTIPITVYYCNRGGRERGGGEGDSEHITQ